MENNQTSSFFEVNLSEFSGPIDVLVELIKKKKWDIYQIEVCEIAKQYDAFLKESINKIQIDELAEYLLLNSILLNMKTKAMINDDEHIKLADIEEGRDMLALLAERGAFRNSTGVFQELFKKRQTMVDKTAEDYDDYALKEIPVAKLPKKLNIEKLQIYFQKIVDDVIENSYEKTDNLFRDKVEFTQYSIKDIQQQIIEYLKHQEKRKDTLLNCFLNNLENNHTKGYFSAFFLAILTLIKYSMITISECGEESYIVQLEENLDLKLIDIINED